MNLIIILSPLLFQHQCTGFCSGSSPKARLFFHGIILINLTCHWSVLQLIFHFIYNFFIVKSLFTTSISPE